MASHEGSRKRLKISRTESKPTSSTMASASAGAPTQACNSAVDGACSHEISLKALHTDLDAMRQIVTCKVCHRLLYEPYSLACGHTYCYSCLSQWLVGKPKKTCPDCRAVVNQQPTPSYLIRELVLIFVSRNELLPDGETIEEHNEMVKEEAEVVAKDKANTNTRDGGLFKGCFKRGLRGYIGPIHDAADGVDRCPACHWELEDGFCNQCGEEVDPHEHVGYSDYDDDDSDLTDDDLDHELDAEDAAAVFGADGQDEYLDYEHDLAGFDHIVANPQPRGMWARRGGGRPLPSRGPRITVDLRSSDDENDSEADDEGDSELTGFVVDDDNVEWASSNEDEEASTAVHAPSRRRAHVVISDDEDDATPSVNPTSDVEEDPDDEEPVALGSQRRHRGRSTGRQQTRRRAVSSDSDSSTQDEQEFIDQVRNQVRNSGGFSPLDSSVVGDYTASYRSGNDSDGVSTVHPMDDDDGQHGYLYQDGQDEDDQSERSDDDVWGTHGGTPTNSRRPPRTSSHRLQQLGSHSNRHAHAPGSAMMRNTPAYPQHPYRPNFSINATAALPPQPAARSGIQVFQPAVIAARAREALHRGAHRGATTAPRTNGMIQPHQTHVQLPPHPFGLGSTLSDVNSRTTGPTRNYNQRNHLSRHYMAPSTVSAHCSRSSTGGGVELRDNASGGSSSTLRQSANSGRRKRVLSVSSDDSVEEVRRSYAY